MFGWGFNRTQKTGFRAQIKTSIYFHLDDRRDLLDMVKVAINVTKIHNVPIGTLCIFILIPSRDPSDGLELRISRLSLVARDGSVRAGLLTLYYHGGHIADNQSCGRSNYLAKLCRLGHLGLAQMAKPN